MEPLYVGLLITFGGFMFFWGWAIKLHSEDPKVKAKKIIDELETYRENMRKLDVGEDYIYETELEFHTLEEIKTTNKKLKESIKKYNL